MEYQSITIRIKWYKAWKYTLYKVNSYGSRRKRHSALFTFETMRFKTNHEGVVTRWGTLIKWKEIVDYRLWRLAA